MTETKRLKIFGKKVDLNLDKWDYDGLYIREKPILERRKGVLGFFGFTNKVGHYYLVVLPSISITTEEVSMTMTARYPTYRSLYKFNKEEDAIVFIEELQKTNARLFHPHFIKRLI